MNRDELVQFERDVITAFEAGQIRAPIHLSGGNEDALIEIFKQVKRTDWVFSTHRSHYHALLHGIPPDDLMQQILAGYSMSVKGDRFITSSIVGGCLPMAVGVAAGIARADDDHVYCFIGDMCARMGLFHEAYEYAVGHKLPITFVIEDNGMSTDTPTDIAWCGSGYQYGSPHIIHYRYERTLPHTGTGRRVIF